MGKVKLRMNEEYKYKIIKKLVETNGKKKSCNKAKKISKAKNRMQVIVNKVVKD